MSSVLGKMVSSLAEPSFGIPTDVTFQVMGFRSPELADGPDIERMLGEVRGHKLLLGLFSEVFRRSFYGPAKETKDIIPVKQTTLGAFEKMFEYIYQKEVQWGPLTVLELYDVVNLAEKYDISGLMEEVTNQIVNVPLTMENLMEVADTAAQFTQFPTVSSPLLLTCAKFLKKNTKTPAELLQFATDQAGKDQADTVLQLLALVKGLPAGKDLPALKCHNCREDKCVNGSVITSSDKFIPGCKMVVNRQSAFCVNAGKVYTVVVVEAGKTIVKCTDQNGKDQSFYIIYNNIPTFCYKCD
eukprot:GFUD01112199.1.p1 GENE.GFUD01112199.1~~GFUD01112199.1.p1  ORF type:complete len:299 (-),score=61.73 GFUD01112199.1:141-1037(-)